MLAKLAVFKYRVKKADFIPPFIPEAYYGLQESEEGNSWLDKAFWDDIVRRDLYLNADECVFIGLADKLVHTPGRSKFRSRKKPTATDVSKVQKLMRKFAERTKLSKLAEVKIHFNEEKHEEIKEYDNTEKELNTVPDVKE